MRSMAFRDRVVFPGAVLVAGGLDTSMYSSSQGVLTTYPNKAASVPAVVFATAP